MKDVLESLDNRGYTLTRARRLGTADRKPKTSKKLKKAIKELSLNPHSTFWAGNVAALTHILPKELVESTLQVLPIPALKTVEEQLTLIESETEPEPELEIHAGKLRKKKHPTKGGTGRFTKTPTFKLLGFTFQDPLLTQRKK